MSPLTYSRLRRLNLVRSALRRTDPETATVAEVARRHGFSQLGRFANHYREVFGETPSTTLRAAQSVKGIPIAPLNSPSARLARVARFRLPNQLKKFFGVPR